VWFVVTADHGEEFGERGSWGHAHTLHPEAMRIPLIISDGKGVTKVHQGLARGMDIATTIGGLAQVGFAAGSADLLSDAAAPVELPMETSRFDTAKLGLLMDDPTGSRLRVEVDFVQAQSVVYDHERDPNENSPDRRPLPDLVSRTLGTVGERWTAVMPIATPGWAWTADLHEPRHGIPQGAFSLYPPDAVVAGEGVRNAPMPPSLVLSDQTKEQLEALGYQQ
jgi:hypothetical protein